MAAELTAIPVTKWKDEAFNFQFTIETREQLEAAAHEIADKQIELAELTSRQAKLVARVQARYAKPIDELGKAVSEKLDAAYAWCLKNEASEFADSKTIEFPVSLGKHLVALHKLYSVVMIQADEQIYSHGNGWQCNGKVQNKM